jgi:hypothetical protein
MNKNDIKITTFEGNLTNKFDDIHRNEFVFIKTNNLISTIALDSIIPKIQTGKCVLMVELSPKTVLKEQFPLILHLHKMLLNHQKPYFMVKLNIPLTTQGFEAFKVFLRLFTEYPQIRLRNLYLSFIGKETDTTKQDFYSLINGYSAMIHVDFYNESVVYSRLKQLFITKQKIVK